MPVCSEQEAERRARETIAARESPDAVKRAIAEIIAGQAVTQDNDVLRAKAGGIAPRDLPSQVTRRDLYINGDQTWVVANTPGGSELRIRDEARPDLVHGSDGHSGTVTLPSGVVRFGVGGDVPKREPVTLQSALDQQQRWADRVPQSVAFCPRCEAHSRHFREKRYCSPACYQRAMAAMVHPDDPPRYRLALAEARQKALEAERQRSWFQESWRRQRESINLQICAARSKGGRK